MDKTRLQRRIDELGEGLGWYQAIDLKNGMRTVSTKVWGSETDHPRRRWEAVEPGFPGSFAGKTVLDVGCNAGYFSFVAADRGARYVCGVDYNEHYIKQAQFCNEVRGDKVDFRVGDVMSILQMRRTFDITLCIAVLYHLPDMWGAVRAIGRVTTEMAIIESAIHNDSDREPLVLFAGGDAKKAGTWHPNICALEHMFRAVGFSRTEPIFKDGGRGGIVAYV